MAYNMYHTQLAKAWTQVRRQQQLPGAMVARGIPDEHCSSCAPLSLEVPSQCVAAY